MGYHGYVTLFQPSTDCILHSVNLFISLLITFSPKNEILQFVGLLELSASIFLTVCMNEYGDCNKTGSALVWKAKLL